MCAQREAMKAVRTAAECLSAVCRARSDPHIRELAGVYGDVTKEPIPGDLLTLLYRLGTTSGPQT